VSTRLASGLCQLKIVRTSVGDHSGRLVAASLGGASHRINLVPQSSTLNRKDWKAMENYLRKELEAGKTVSIKIDVGYSAGGGVRPNNFTVNAIIDGEKREFKFTQ